MTVKRVFIETDIDFKLPSITFLQWYYGILVERYGKDSFEARFYQKFADSWFPHDWTKQELEAELARPRNYWSRRMQEAFASTVSKE